MGTLEIPWRQLSNEALQGVIEEFVSREGTEYGARDVDLATKVAQVRRQLERGEVLVFFDTEASSCHLVSSDSLSRSRERVAEGRERVAESRDTLSPDPSPARGRGE